MKVAIYSRGLDTEQGAHLDILLEALTRFDVYILIYQPLLLQFNQVTVRFPALVPFVTSADLPEELDCLISLGGDGTLLDTVTLVRNKKIPVLGINFGRLGFLAGFSRDELSSAVDALVNRTFIIDKRTLIHLDSDKNLFGDAPFGLNEFAIHKRDTSPMIKVHAYLNGEFLNTYWADGLIVSTPTGSTGYNLSCGGPIITPGCQVHIITPIAAHNLNVRPVVVPDHMPIDLTLESRDRTCLVSLDGVTKNIKQGEEIRVTKAEFLINVIKFEHTNFLDTIRNKMYWGVDNRN